MKHKGCTLAFEKQRNAELLGAWHVALHKCGTVNVCNVASIAVNSECSRFWVSEERANIVCSEIKRRGKVCLLGMRSTKREMYEEIYRRACIEKERGNVELLSQAVARVIYKKAPKFYMKPRSALEIIYKLKK